MFGLSHFYVDEYTLNNDNSRLFKLSPGSESYHILLRQDIKVIGSKDIRDSVKTPTVHIGKTLSNFCQLRLINL